MIKQATTSELAFWSALTPRADAMAHSTFQERFRGIAKSLNDYSRAYIRY
jgi:hypothetical protein